jgi:hypothetical protein
MRGSEICEDVMNINDGLRMLCDTSTCDSKGAGGNFNGPAGAAPISTFWGGPTRWIGSSQRLQMEKSVEPAPRGPLGGSRAPYLSEMQTAEVQD